MGGHVQSLRAGSQPAFRPGGTSFHQGEWNPGWRVAYLWDRKPGIWDAVDGRRSCLGPKSCWKTRLSDVLCDVKHFILDRAVPNVVSLLLFCTWGTIVMQKTNGMLKSCWPNANRPGSIREGVSPGNPADLIASSPGGGAVPAARTVVHSWIRSLIHSCLGSFIVLGQLYAAPCIISTIIMLLTFVYLPRKYYIGAGFSPVFIPNTAVVTGAMEGSSKSEKLGKPTYSLQEGFLWSPVAPVDMFHQGFVTKSITPGRWTISHATRVCPLSQSFQYKNAPLSPPCDDEQRPQQLCHKTHFLFF